MYIFAAISEFTMTSNKKQAYAIDWLGMYPARLFFSLRECVSTACGVGKGRSRHALTGFGGLSRSGTREGGLG
jgi:hypothetical protein